MFKRPYKATRALEDPVVNLVNWRVVLPQRPLVRLSQTPGVEQHKPPALISKICILPCSRCEMMKLCIFLLGRLPSKRISLHGACRSVCFFGRFLAPGLNTTAAPDSHPLAPSDLGISGLTSMVPENILGRIWSAVSRLSRISLDARNTSGKHIRVYPEHFFVGGGGLGWGGLEER